MPNPTRNPKPSPKPPPVCRKGPPKGDGPPPDPLSRVLSVHFVGWLASTDTPPNINGVMSLRPEDPLGIWSGTATTENMTLEVELEILADGITYNISANYSLGGSPFAQVEWEGVTPIDADPLRFAQMAGSDPLTSDGFQLTIQA